MEGKTALIAGVSGLVGGELLDVLLEASEYKQIKILVRRSLGVTHAKLVEHVINFDELAKYKELFKVDEVFCCLGTTIKKAGSQKAFKRVDVDYPLEMARLAKAMKAEKFLVVSSMGAEAKSKLFYSRMKGLLEEELKTIGFKALHIFRPSLLLGDRKEFRLGEKVSSILMAALPFIFVGGLRKYKAIEAKDVARGMYHAAQKKGPGGTYLSHEIEGL